MKIVVLEAGLTSSCAARDLIKTPDVSEVVVADLERERTEFVASLGRGVLPPENCVDPTTLFSELAKRDMPVTISGPSQFFD